MSTYIERIKILVAIHEYKQIDFDIFVYRKTYYRPTIKLYPVDEFACGIKHLKVVLFNNIDST